MVDDVNTGNNTSFYLNIDKWFKTISPSSWHDERKYVIHVWSTGNIHYSNVEYGECGVQFIGLCY